MKIKLLHNEFGQYQKVKAIDTNAGTITIADIIPTSFYLSKVKLNSIIDHYCNKPKFNSLPPLIFTVIENEVLLIDGHHRITAALQHERKLQDGLIIQITDEREINTYRILSKMAVENNFDFRLLEKTILNHNDYLERWLSFCSKIYDNFEAHF